MMGFRKEGKLWEYFLVGVLALSLGGSGCVKSGGSHRKLSKFAPVELQTLDGKPFDLLGEVKRHRATVLFWWGSTCPCVRRYRDRIHQIREEYGKHGVAVYAVASNADDTPEKIKRIAQEQNFKIKILYDAGGNLASYLGVMTTPTTVVLDSEGRVRYMGWIDNERRPGELGREPYLEEALSALLSNKKIARERGPVYGCMITRSLRPAQARACNSCGR